MSNDGGDAIVFPTLFSLSLHFCFFKREETLPNNVASTPSRRRSLSPHGRGFGVPSLDIPSLAYTCIRQMLKCFSATAVYRYRAIRRFPSIFSHSYCMQSFPLFFMCVLFICMYLLLCIARKRLFLTSK